MKTGRPATPTDRFKAATVGRTSVRRTPFVPNGGFRPVETGPTGVPSSTDVAGRYAGGGKLRGNTHGRPAPAW